MSLVILCSLLLLCIASTIAQPPPDPTVYPDCINGPLSKFPICNSGLDEVTRARDIISRLNVSEKITRIGQAYGGNSISRIGLPTYHFRQNAIHGLGPGVLYANAGQEYSNSTIYAHIINLGASFDKQLFNEVGSAIADEARAYANAGRAGLDWFTPNINIFRDPRWGRGQETPGEDPLLSSEFAAQFVQGLQSGEDKRFLKTVADCKHYAGYDVEHWGGVDRSNYNAIISNLDLVETYLPSFEACVKDGKVGSIMCSYNSVNGVPSCANSFFLQTILRENWGWDEYNWVVSDCGGIGEIYTTHHYATSPEQAVQLGLQAGTDVNCGPYYAQYGQSAYDKGLINDADLDTALMRQFVSLVRMGYFDNGALQPYRQYGLEQINSEAHQRLSVLSALESIVLLKNDAMLLPLAKDVNIALIGPNANAAHTLLGNYESPVPYTITIPDALTTRGVKFSYVQGTSINSTNKSGFAAAVALATSADYVVYVGGIDNSIEAEGKDRYDIGMPGNQNELISAISKASKKPIVLVVLGGGQIDLSMWKNADSGVGAIVWAGYPGQSGGEAIIQVLLGEWSPSGRLCSTQYPADYVSAVSMLDQSMRPSSTNPGRTYKFYTGTPVYAFGDGLSYSTFTYTRVDEDIHRAQMLHPTMKDTLHEVYDISVLSASARDNDRHADIAYYLTINNTGSVVSDITALAFISSNASMPDVSAPIKELFDFVHIRQLAVGSGVTVYMQMSYRSLVHTDTDGHQWLLPGEYEISINNDAVWRYRFSLVGEPQMVKAWPQQEDKTVQSGAAFRAALSE